MYRFATALAPYATHPDLPQFHGQVERVRASALAAFGALARARGIRLSTHPGQYIGAQLRETRTSGGGDRATSRCRPRCSTRWASGPRPSCVLHVGGTGGGDDAALERFDAGLRAAVRAGARAARGRERRPHVLAHRRAASSPPHRAARRLGHPASPLPRPRRHPRPRGAGARAGDLAGRRRAEDPLLLAATATSRSARCAVGRRVERRWVLPQLRAHADLIDPIGFEHFLRDDAGRARLRRHARGQGQGPRAPAPARAARRARASPARVDVRSSRPPEPSRTAAVRRQPNPE